MEKEMKKVETAETNVGKMEMQLREWGVRLDELIARVDGVGTGAKAEYRKSVEDLKGKYQTAQTKVTEMKSAGSEKWETFKNGMEIVWKDLEVAFKKLTQ